MRHFIVHFVIVHDAKMQAIHVDIRGKNELLILLLSFLGHLSHSGDLLLWVGVRRRSSFVVRRASCIVRRALTSSSQELLGQS